MQYLTSHFLDSSKFDNEILNVYTTLESGIDVALGIYILTPTHQITYILKFFHLLPSLIRNIAHEKIPKIKTSLKTRGLNNSSLLILLHKTDKNETF